MAAFDHYSAELQRWKYLECDGHDQWSSAGNRTCTRVNDTGEETFGLLCFAEITEFAKELHSEMEKVVLMDELPENWTYPLIQPKLIEKYLQVKIIL